MKYQPELFEAPPGTQEPIPSSTYLTYAEKVQTNNSKLPGKSWLIWGYILVFISVITLPTGGFIVTAPIAALLLWHYYSKHASYRKAISPIPYTPRTSS